VEVELEVVVVPVPVELVVEVELVVVLELGKVNVREMFIPAGTCVIVPVVRTIGWTDMVGPGIPAGNVADELTLPVALEALAATFEVEVAGVLLMTVTVTGAAARPSAWAVRSLRKALALTPPRSLCAHWVNCWLLGAVWRIDSNSEVTFRPAAVSARGLATSASCPAPESRTRSSRHDAAPVIDGTNRRWRRGEIG
jgi:hypothetical protein